MTRAKSQRAPRKKKRTEKDILTADSRRFTQILVCMPVGHVSAILAEKLSVSIGVHPQLVTLNALLYALCALLFPSRRKSAVKLFESDSSALICG